MYKKFCRSQARGLLKLMEKPKLQFDNNIVKLATAAESSVKNDPETAKKFRQYLIDEPGNL